jgi:dehydrogenase/reductase SDR family protein 12
MGGQFSATSQFYLHGRSHFTRTGYEAHTKAYANYKCIPDVVETANLFEKIFMVTGANAGIGKEITTYLVSKGATVYMVCRNEAKAKDSRQAISEKAGPGSEERLPLLICDCSLESDVRKMWSQFTEERKRIEKSTSSNFIPKLDGLICNAGALMNTRTLTKEGVEITLAAHLLFGTYLLGTLALPSLAASSGRMIIVSSGGMLNTKFPSWELATSTGKAAKKFDGQLAYAYAKRGQVNIHHYTT